MNLRYLYKEVIKQVYPSVSLGKVMHGVTYCNRVHNKNSKHMEQPDSIQSNQILVLIQMYNSREWNINGRVIQERRNQMNIRSMEKQNVWIENSLWGMKRRIMRPIPEYLCQFALLEHHQAVDESLSLNLANCISFLQKWRKGFKVRKKHFSYFGEVEMAFIKGGDV